MGALTSALGDVAQSYGSSYLQDREFNQKQQALAAQIQNMQAGQQHAAGELQLQRDMFDAGKWQIDRENFQDEKGQPVPMLVNKISGEARPISLPAGTMDAKSLNGILKQMEAATGQKMSDLPPDEQYKRLLIAMHLNPMMGVSVGTGVDAQGNPTNVLINKGNATATPVKDANGNVVNKPVPNSYQTLTDANGNQRLVNMPKFAKPVVPNSTLGGGNFQATPFSTPAPAPAQNPTPAKTASPAQVQSYADQYKIPYGQALAEFQKDGVTVSTAAQTSAPTAPAATGNIKSFAKFSPESQKVLQGINQSTPLLNNLDNLLKTTGRDQNKGFLNELEEKASVSKDFWLYSHGMGVGDPLHQAQFALADLYRNLATGEFLNGIRRGDLIAKIQTHMPTATDTPNLLRQKVEFLKTLNPQIQQAIIDYEKQRVKGPNFYKAPLAVNPPYNPNQPNQ